MLTMALLLLRMHLINAAPVQFSQFISSISTDKPAKQIIGKLFP